MLKGSAAQQNLLKELSFYTPWAANIPKRPRIPGGQTASDFMFRTFFFFQLASKITKAVAIAIGCWRLIPVSEDPTYLGHKNQMTQADLIWVCSICALAFIVLESTIRASEGGKQSIFLSNCAVSDRAIQMPSVWGLTRPEGAIQITVLQSKMWDGSNQKITHLN